MRSAVNSGYARGFRTILDANMLTLLTAAVIFEFATAQPKGFAFTLILGVLVSMFTAVVSTRAMLGLLADFAFFNRPAFMGVKAGRHPRRSTTRPTAGRRPRRRPASAGVERRRRLRAAAAARRRHPTAGRVERVRPSAARPPPRKKKK